MVNEESLLLFLMFSLFIIIVLGVHIFMLKVTPLTKVFVFLERPSGHENVFWGSWYPKPSLRDTAVTRICSALYSLPDNSPASRVT